MKLTSNLLLLDKDLSLQLSVKQKMVMLFGSKKLQLVLTVPNHELIQIQRVDSVIEQLVIDSHELPLMESWLTTHTDMFSRSSMKYYKMQQMDLKMKILLNLKIQLFFDLVILA